MLVFAFMLVLALTKMLTMVMPLMITTLLRCIGLLHCRRMSRRHHNGRRILAAYCRTGSAAYCSANDCTILAANLLADRRTRCAAQSAAHHCTTIHCINIQAGCQQQTDY